MWSFHTFLLFFLQRTVDKTTKIYNARTELLYFSLNLLFSDVLVAVALVPRKVPIISRLLHKICTLNAEKLLLILETLPA